MTPQEKERGYSDATHALIERMKKEPEALNRDKVNKLVREAYLYANLPVPKMEWVKCIPSSPCIFKEIILFTFRCFIKGSKTYMENAAKAAGNAVYRAFPVRYLHSIAYDFDHLGELHEYLQIHKGNKHDHTALHLFMLFLEMKENGLGYWAEKNGVLYLVPFEKQLKQAQD